MIGAAVTTEQLADLVAQHIAQQTSTPWGATVQHMVLWSPGLLILIGIYYLVSKPPAFISAFISAQQSQAVAMAKMAEAVERATSRDNDRLEELLINNQVIIRKLEELAHGLGPHTT
jgi:hypothetical protein